MELIFQGFMDEKVQGGHPMPPPLVHVGLKPNQEPEVCHNVAFYCVLILMKIKLYSVKW